MIFIYGFGMKTTKTYGTKKLDKCGVSLDGSSDYLCTNDTYDYQRVVSWINLFFIPIIPYSFKYYRVCSDCKSAVELDKNDFFAELNDSNTENNAKSSSQMAHE